MVPREEVEDLVPNPIGIVANRVYLRAIARRNDEPFINGRTKSPKAVDQRVAREGELFPDIDWSVFMVRSDDNDHWCRQGRDPVRSGELLFAGRKGFTVKNPARSRWCRSSREGYPRSCRHSVFQCSCAGQAEYDPMIHDHERAVSFAREAPRSYSASMNVIRRVIRVTVMLDRHITSRPSIYARSHQE